MQERPTAAFNNHPKRFRWNPFNPGQNEDKPEDQMGVPFELVECIGKIGRSPYMQDLTPIKEAQVNHKSIYALATAHVQPNYFWLQYSTTRNQAPDSMYTSILKSINSAKQRTRQQRFIYNEIAIGIGCNAQFSDGNWYRALVTQLVGSDYVKVLFPDYGNIETLPMEDLIKVVHCQYSVPLQAFCACLYNIRPQHQDMWPQIGARLKKFFDEHIHDDLIVKVRKVRSDYIVDCDIFLIKRVKTSGDKLYRQHIAQDIVDEGLASFIDPVAAHSLKEESKIKKEPSGLSVKHYANFNLGKPMADEPVTKVKMEIKQEKDDY